MDSSQGAVELVNLRLASLAESCDDSRVAVGYIIGARKYDVPERTHKLFEVKGDID